MVGVSDGDTITVLDDAKIQHKIRFAGIDAPEKGQAFGERSKQSLSALVFQKRVEARCHKKDRYGRDVCAVFVSLRDVGLEQIRAGMAWHYKEYQHEQPTHERLVYSDTEADHECARSGYGRMRSRCRPGNGDAAIARRRHGDDLAHCRRRRGYAQPRDREARQLLRSA